MSYLDSLTLVGAHEKVLQDLVDAISLTSTAIANAEQCWTSVAGWLDRSDGPLAGWKPDVSPQGSFMLGTSIRPVGDREDFDADGVVLLRAMNKLAVSQQYLKKIVQDDLEAYRQAHSMRNPVEDTRRCCTLHYAEGAGFRLDLLPAIPKGVIPDQLTHTDRKCSSFRDVGVWPSITGPKALAKWFKAQMDLADIDRALGAYQRRTGKVLATREDLPVRWVRSPLTDTVKLLKRHANAVWSGDPDRPIGVITSTLAGHAYGGERTIGDTLRAVLPRMRSFIKIVGRVGFVPNPGCPEENFADKWAEEERKQAIYLEWLERAEQDFLEYLSQPDDSVIPAGLREGMTEKTIGRALGVSAPAYMRSPAAAISAEIAKVAQEGRSTKPWMPQ